MAPEALQGALRFDEKIDSWSLGVILYNLVTGKMPFSGPEKKVKFNTLNRAVQFPDIAWAQCSPSVKEIARGLLQRDSSMRYSMDKVI